MSATRWEPSAYAAAVRGEIARMAGVVQGADSETPVPSCPEWTLAELVEHTGTIHRWAAQMVRVLATERLDPGTLDLGLPTEAGAYADWLAAGAAPLVEAFAATDPDAPMWAWGADQHARFWSRRMLHETTVHRVDAELALGAVPRVDAPIAADGIDELLENLPCAEYFRPRVAELRGAGESIALRSTDGDHRWLIRLAPDGFRWERGDRDDGAPTVSVAARADDLLLLAYARRAVTDDGIAVTGDLSVLEFWLERSAL